jgi:hypothetical protein
MSLNTGLFWRFKQFNRKRMTNTRNEEKVEMNKNEKINLP